ncbi:MAG TPA: rhodanese-like domain-containing protein [Gammaproteobacteria bacterium]|nr:rhodanese-like domain-containing protein [Gammaproteobacteria bacterium]
MLIGNHCFCFSPTVGVLTFSLTMAVCGLPCLADVGSLQTGQEKLQTLFEPKGRSQSTATDLKSLPPERRQMECGYQVSNEDAGNPQESKDDTSTSMPGGGGRHQCLGDPGELIKQWKDGNVVLIDVRPQKDYEHYHLPGSLNIPAYSIKTKSFLKSEPLVLIGDGVSVASLLSVCGSLKVSGFSRVTVFGGGVHAWRELMTDNSAFKLKQNVRKLTPKQFVSVKNEYQWLIVSLDKNVDEVKKELGRFRIIRYSEGDAVFARKPDQTFASRNPVGDWNLLFVSRDGARYAGVDAGLFKTYSNSMYYLEGGLEAYRKYIKTRSALLARANAKPRQEKGCGL